MNTLTAPQQIRKKENTICHICKNVSPEDRVADHCHLTGEYRGPAHNKRNLEY